MHTPDCRYLPPRLPDCSCGELAREQKIEALTARVAELEEERTTIERLIEEAEEVTFRSPSSRRFTVKMVSASDLLNVLSGRLR